MTFRTVDWLEQVLAAAPRHELLELSCRWAHVLADEAHPNFILRAAAHQLDLAVARGGTGSAKATQAVRVCALAQDRSELDWPASAERITRYLAMATAIQMVTGDHEVNSGTTAWLGRVAFSTVHPEERPYLQWLREGDDPAVAIPLLLGIAWTPAWHETVMSLLDGWTGTSLELFATSTALTHRPAAS